jgi:ubiquinone biosynthesis protein
MLLHGYLKRGDENSQSDKLALELLQEQKRTNRMLQWLIALVIGFSLGAVAMQILAGIRHF